MTGYEDRAYTPPEAAVNPVGQREDLEVPVIEGPKPISVEISTEDVQMLYATQTSPVAYMQLILAKLKDAGAPVEGVLHLKLAHGSVFKVKDNVMQEQAGFLYMWLPEAYVHAIANAGGVQ